MAANVRFKHVLTGDCLTLGDDIHRSNPREGTPILMVAPNKAQPCSQLERNTHAR